MKGSDKNSKYYTPSEDSVYDQGQVNSLCGNDSIAQSFWQG